MSEELSEIEKRWIEGWTTGIAKFIARGPTGEPLPEYESELATVKRILMEKQDELAPLARKWRQRLVEVVQM